MEATRKQWDVMCNVDKLAIDVTNKTGYLYTPELNYPDMASTIDCFTSVDPECEAIFTFVGGRADMVYAKIDGTWEARDGRNK